MSITSIKNRLARIEDDRGIGMLPFVVIHGNQPIEEAFAERGLKPGDPAQVMHIRYVSARA